MKRFALYDDYKGLYNKVVPPIKGVENKIDEFTKEHNQMKEIIRKFDEIITTKAQRTEVFQLA